MPGAGDVMDCDDAPADDAPDIDVSEDELGSQGEDCSEAQQGGDDDPPDPAALKPNSKAAAKSKNKSKGGKLKVMNDMGKARSRTKDGKKFCPACGKWLPIADFPAGSGQCGDDRKALQNLKKAAMAQDQMEWWEETIRDPTKLKRVVKDYKDRMPPPGKKRKEFCILQYKEERRQESAIIVDGVMEMMTERAYVVWMGKPKNGCMDAEEAKKEWDKLFRAPDAITDEKGTHPRYRQRVAIRKMRRSKLEHIPWQTER